MLKFFRKHYILTIFLLMPFFLYGYYYFTYVRYHDDRIDFRHYPIPSLTEKWTKTIEYDTLPIMKLARYFVIAFNWKQLEENLEKEFGKQYYDNVYEKKYSPYNGFNLDNERFYENEKDKPIFVVKVYKGERLLETRIIYFTEMLSSETITIDNGYIDTMGIVSYNSFYLHEKSHYRFEITNVKKLPEFENVDVFLTIRPISPKI